MNACRLMSTVKTQKGCYTKFLRTQNFVYTGTSCNNLILLRSITMSLFVTPHLDCYSRLSKIPLEPPIHQLSPFPNHPFRKHLRRISHCQINLIQIVLHKPNLRLRTKFLLNRIKVNQKSKADISQRFLQINPPFIQYGCVKLIASHCPKIPWPIGSFPNFFRLHTPFQRIFVIFFLAVKIRQAVVCIRCRCMKTAVNSSLKASSYSPRYVKAIPLSL